LPRGRNTGLDRSTCVVFGEFPPQSPPEAPMSNARIEARQDAYAAYDDVMGQFDALLANPDLSEAQRLQLVMDRAELELGWDSLTDERRSAGVYRDAARVLERSLANLEAVEASLFGSIGTGVEMSRAVLDLPGLAPRTADWTDGASMQRLLEQNPEGFKSWWGKLDNDQRDVAMMKLQEASQQRAQFQTMMTNLMSAQHEALMAVARNLAV
jgi:hypothetical protein